MNRYGMRVAAGALGAGAVVGTYFNEAAQNTTYTSLTSLVDRVTGIEQELGLPTMVSVESVSRKFWFLR
jgi:hypothetical protein